MRGRGRADGFWALNLIRVGLIFISKGLGAWKALWDCGAGFIAGF